MVSGPCKTCRRYRRWRCHRRRRRRCKSVIPEYRPAFNNPTFNREVQADAFRKPWVKIPFDGLVQVNVQNVVNGIIGQLKLIFDWQRAIFPPGEGRAMFDTPRN